jgi:hypothetical protein
VTKDLQGTYAPMIKALADVAGPNKEMERRYQQQETVTEPFEQLTIIIDEAKDVVEQCPEIAALYRRIVTIGAEARVRLILLSTTDRARKLGFEGEADSLEGFVTIRLGSFARRVLPTCGGTSENPKHWAAVNLGEWIAVDTRRTKELLDKAAPSMVWPSPHYNCQVPSTKVGTSPRPAMVQHPISADTSTAEEDFLAQMFAKYGSRLAPKEVSMETHRESGPESLGNSAGGNGTGKSQKMLSDAGSEDFRLVLQSAKDALKTVSPDEGRKLGNACKLFTRGVGKQEAIMQGFELTSAGRGYSRGKELFDALRLLQEHGLLTR